MGYSINKQDLFDIANGGIILGSGGGGDRAVSYSQIDDIFSVTDKVEFVSLNEVPDDACVCIISAMGSPLATKAHGFTPEVCVNALARLELVTGKKIEYVAAFETGGGNFMPPLYVAAKCGLKAIDADGIGRAVPESNMTMVEVAGVAGAPFAMADENNVGAVLYFTDSLDCERMGRPIITALEAGSIGVANYIMDGKTAKAALIPDTYAAALSVGQALRKAKDDGADPVSAIVEATGGVEVFRGKVTEFVAEVRDSHDWGHYVLEGCGEYAGRTMKVMMENENIIAYDEDGKPKMMIPDAVCMLMTDGTPLTNAELQEGDVLGLFAVECADAWKNEKAFAVYKECLKRLGYEGAYISCMELNS